MADEKQPNKTKEFITKNGEKVGLGVAVLALLAYLVFGIALAKDDGSVDKLKSQIRRLDDEKAKRHQKYTAEEVKVDSGKVLGPWNTVATGAPGSDVIAKGPTDVKFKEVPKPVEIVKAVRVPTIDFDSTSVDFDGITVNWKINSFTKQEKAKFAKEKPPVDVLDLHQLVIEREINGSGKWEKIAELDGGATAYKDSNITPKTKYAYRITSIPDPDKDPKRIERGETGKGMTISTPGQVLTQGIWKVSFASPSKPEGAPRGTVFLTLEKYEKGRGAVLIKHIQEAGQKIGEWEDPQGSGNMVTMHRVFKDGKGFQVDFNTGFVLESVEPIVAKFEVKKCRLTVDSTGEKKCAGVVTTKREIPTYEITYKDDEGTKKRLVPDPRASSVNQNDLCENHGGSKKIVVDLPKDSPSSSTPKGPEPPKVDPKAAAKQKREDEAAKLYEDAEKAYNAKDPRKALSNYEKIMKDYADTDFVNKQHRTDLEEKIARLKK